MEQKLNEIIDRLDRIEKALGLKESIPNNSDWSQWYPTDNTTGATRCRFERRVLPVGYPHGFSDGGNFGMRG